MNKVMVINRASCGVSYEIPELMVTRVFRSFGSTGDRMEIEKEELKALSYKPGGRILLDSYLMIEDEGALSDLSIEAEPEYFYNEEDVLKLLKKGTMDQLLDCLEFAPKGVLELLKKVAVEIRLDSNEKRKAISEKLHVNLDAMIKNDIIISQANSNGDSAGEVEKPVAKRRSAPVKKTTTKK